MAGRDVTNAVVGSTWVDATPFRAHLRFLTAVGSLSAADVAALAGISSAAAGHLLDGRDGRTLRRISPEMARRLLSVSVADVRGLRWRLMPAGRARAQLERLRRAGLSNHDIAELTGLSVVEVAGLPGARHCSELVTVRLLATARAHDAQLTSGRRRTATALPTAA